MATTADIDAQIALAITAATEADALAAEHGAGTNVSVPAATRALAHATIARALATRLGAGA